MDMSSNQGALCTGAGCRPPESPACSFNGQILAAGEAVTAYLNSASAACTSERRVCQANGSLSGSFVFATCDAAANAHAACLFDGRTIAHGDAVSAFAAPGTTAACATEARVCADGHLSGSLPYAICAAPGAAACLFDGRTIPDGQIARAFAASTVPSGQTCAPQPRVCHDGALSDSGAYGSCTIGGAPACLFNEQTVVSGQDVAAFASSNGAPDQTCVPEIRTCASGTLSGTAAFASCQSAKGRSCLLNGVTIPDGGVATLFNAPVVDVGQSCATERRACVDGTLSGTATSATCFARQKSISAAYQPPLSKEGASDVLYDAPAAILDARYARFKQIGVGYKSYNLFWNRIESGAVASSAAPVACPAGTFLAPANEVERQTWGFHKFRCLTTAEVAIFDRLLMRDAAQGIQSGVVLWNAPVTYRYPGCLGSDFAGALLRDGCVPRDDAMDDYEDYVNFLANRYSGRGGFGKISHFIVWNENASATWFDYSPVVNTRGPVSATDQAKWINKYAQLVMRTHDAAQRNLAGVMIDVSTDLYWQPPTARANLPAHIGNQNLIDGLWQILGTKYSWSIAVHPYGNLDVAPANGRYSFLNVESVANYQIARLQALGLPPTSLVNPQAYLIATEQGWAQAEGIARQAKFICQAQALTLQVPLLLSQSHNYFHSIEPQETAGGASNQGAFFGLIPFAAPTDLSTMEQYATGAAYLATSGTVWGQTSSNYCCQQAGVGCRAPTGSQPIYRFLIGGQHFFSSLLREGLMAKFKFESTGFTTFTDAANGRTALYRCRTGTSQWFASTEAGCEGQTTEATFGYVARAAAPGLVPLYRTRSVSTGDHLATLNPNEGAPDYQVEQTLGYVPAL